MNRLTDNLDSIAERIRKDFTTKDETREKVLPLCREVIRHASTAIRAVHRQEFKPANKLLKSARSLLREAEQAIASYSELGHAGFFHDAQKEKAPTPDELEISFTAYLNGLGEAVGELRRYLLDSIRRDDLSRVEELLTAMDDIYNILITMDFPEAITGGLRRTTDMVRGVLERTRSDLTLVRQQSKLEKKLKLFEDKL